MLVVAILASVFLVLGINTKVITDELAIAETVKIMLTVKNRPVGELMNVRFSCPSNVAIIKPVVAVASIHIHARVVAWLPVFVASSLA